ncbi:MAG: ABC transporter substrate-binding protein [Streptosporangiales bacterium]|nr:ABC transporter substrate-binding protein [Streptosporangiales bacterium]
MAARPRRRLRCLAGGIGVVALTLAACGGGAGDSGGGSSTIELAFLAPLSGPLAQVGVDMRNGAQTAVREINASGGVNGAKLELQVYNDQLDPTAGTRAARDAVSAGQQIVVGILSSSVCLAVAPVVDKLGGVLVGTTCSADQLVGPDRPAENFFGVTAHNAQMVSAGAQIMSKEEKGLTTVDVFGYDYIVGHELYDGFREQMQRRGVPLAEEQQQWVPLTSVDYRPQVAAMARNLPKSHYPDRVLWLSTYGAGTTTFLQQSASSRLTSKYGVIMTSGGYAPGAWELNGTAPEVWDVYDYEYQATKNPANDSFVSSYQKVSGGRPPTAWSWENYVGIKFVAEAIKKAGDSDPQNVAKALEGLRVDTPSGPATMDPAAHLAKHNVVVFKSVGDKSAPQGLKVTKYYQVSYDGKIVESDP